MELTKIHLPAEKLSRRTSIYCGWALSGILVVGALLSTLALAFMHGRRRFRCGGKRRPVHHRNTDHFLEHQRRF